MIEKLLKITAVFSGILLIIVLSSSIIYSALKKEDIYDTKKEINKGINNEVSKDESTIIIDKNEIDDKGTINDRAVMSNSNMKESLGDKYIYFPLLKDADSIEIIDLYRSKSIQITVTGVHKDEFDPLVMKRINGSKEYSDLSLLQVESESKSIYITTAENNVGEELLPINYEHVNALSSGIDNANKSQDPVIGFDVEYKNVDLDKQDVVLTIKFDELYAPTLYKSEEGVYVSLKKPKDVYENIVVIDAGHGGKDSGTYSKGEKYYEKDFNLSIVSLLKETFNDDKVKVYYTRLDDETVYLNPRVNLANEVEADLFLSIHYNASEATSAGGSEVLYNEFDTNTSYTSKMFANNCLDEVVKVTKKVNRGLVKGNEMVIIGNANMPVALVEIGFMTNEEELSFLLDESNRKAIADALHQAVIKSLEDLNLGRVTNSRE